MREIDARGLACPLPVLHTKATLEKEKPAGVRVLVDNAGSQQNVQRFLASQGFETGLERDGEDFVVTGRCGAAAQPAAAPAARAETEKKKIMVMCATDRIGFGD
nr:sulfurtransferase TusA family protein [Desulfobacterales bacterium]